jgi:branched-chain amino acid transport system substrate-binding protein
MMKRKGFAKVASLFLMVIGLLLLPCSQQAQAQEKLVKIGMSGALSGPAAEWGIAWVRAMEILTDETNEVGLNFKGEKYKIKLFVYDDKSSGSEAAIVAKKLAEGDQVHIACYHGGDPPLAVRSILKAGGVLQWGTPYDRRYPSPDYPLNFASFMRYPECMSATYAWLHKKYPAVKRMVQISPNNVSGRGATELIKKHAPELGMELVSTDLYELATTDFTPIIMRVLKDNVDMICLAAAAPQACGLITKQARELGYKGLFLHYVSTDLGVVNEIAGAANAEGFIAVMAVGEPFSAAEKKLMEKYVAKYGGKFPQFALVSYANQQVLVEAIKKSPSPTPEAIAETMRTINTPTLDTIWGKAYFAGKEYYGIDNQFVFPIPVGTLKGGKPTFLDRLEFPGYKIKPF